MLDLMDDDSVLIMKNLIDNTIIAYPKFVESCKVACKRFWSDVVQMCSKPIDTFGDSAGNGLVQATEITRCCLQDADVIHGGYLSPS